MIQKYRAYIDGEFYYFALRDLSIPALTEQPSQRDLIIAQWLVEGNQPDVFTGLQDKGNADIYEKDILDSEHNNPCKVEFKNGCYMGCFYTLGMDGMKVSHPYKLNSFNHNVSVIGNIHQNKELLNDK